MARVGLSWKNTFLVQTFLRHDVQILTWVQMRNTAERVKYVVVTVVVTSLSLHYVCSKSQSPNTPMCAVQVV